MIDIKNDSINTNDTTTNEELNLFLLLRKKIVLIFLVSLIGAVIGLAYAIFEKTKYKASLTFVLEEGGGGGISAYAGIASQFGIDLGSSGGGGAFQGDNIIELFKSRLLIEKTLLGDYTNNKKLADIYFEISDIKKLLSPKVDVEKISFSNHNLITDSIISLMYKEILIRNIGVNRIDKKLSYIDVSFTCIDQKFSKTFTDNLVANVLAFYKETKTQRSKNSVDKLQNRADEILAELNDKTYQAASQLDINVNPSKRIAGVPSEMKMRDKSVLLAMYTEVAKNLEISKVSLMQETPIIQIVDQPILPLEKIKTRKITGIFFGGISALIFVILALIALGLIKSVSAKKNDEE